MLNPTEDDTGAAATTTASLSTDPSDIALQPITKANTHYPTPPSTPPAPTDSSQHKIPEKASASASSQAPVAALAATPASGSTLAPPIAHHAYPTTFLDSPVRTAVEPVPTSKHTIATYLADHPTHSAATAMRRLFPKPNPLMRLVHRFQVKHSVIAGMTDAEMAHWEAQGPILRARAGWKLEGEEGTGAVVSPLFWKMYLSLMPTLTRDPLAGMTTPDLLGSTTTMPLSIISLIPDIMQHYRDVIVRAKMEIFLATNYWQPSNSVNTVAKALRDLSAKVIKDKRPKVVVKVMYDRGSWEQLWNAHASVDPAGYSPLDLPDRSEVPGLELEVINFHKVLLGTFHAKFLIVDRKVALINSNNIQDRPNLELMSHLEGPIVDAFYDVALHSWYNKLAPPLPCLGKPYEPPRDPITGSVRYLFSDHNPYFNDIEILKAARAARLLLRRQTKDVAMERAKADEEAAHPTRDRLREAVRHAMASQRQSLAHTQEEIALRSANAMKELREFGERFGLGSRPNSRRTSATDLTKLAHYTDDETAAITAANARMTLPPGSDGSPTLRDESPIRSKTYPQPHPFSSGKDGEDRVPVIASARPSIDATSAHAHVAFAPLTLGVDGTGRLLDDHVVDSPAASVRGLPLETGDAALVSESEDIVDNTEVLVTSESSPETKTPHEVLGHDGDGHAHGRQGLLLSIPPESRLSYDLPSGSQSPMRSVKVSMDEEIPPGRGSKRMFKLSKRFNAGALSEAWATVEDSDDVDNFRPHVVHAPHDPFPIAMACRKPHGLPGHQDIRNPQNAAWLAGFRYAKRKVFVQTPTLNARPIVRAVKQACRRGVEVNLLLDLGFNDKGESIPFQGGTNEEVVDRLYKAMCAEGKEQYLNVFYYTGKDQIRPLNAVKKQRNCHIKFAAFDDEVMIIGNGNQDSQSWFHSQEINVMIDSKQVVAEMMETLLSNQNTLQYGRVDKDGVWRDMEGKTLQHYGATGSGSWRGLSGFIAFVKTI